MRSIQTVQLRLYQLIALLFKNLLVSPRSFYLDHLAVSPQGYLNFSETLCRKHRSRAYLRIHA